MKHAGFPDAALLERARDHAVRYLEHLPERHVGATLSRAELLQALKVPLAAEGEPPERVVDALAEAAADGTVACAGPRYFGFVIGGSLPVALASDWMVSAWDQNPGIYATSPFVSVVEEIAREWVLELLDLPRQSSVGFVTGGQMANFTCLAAARHGLFRRAGWDVETDGLAGAPRVHLVASAESHVTIDIAMRYLGFGTRAIVRVPSDGQGRMVAAELRSTLARLDGPVLVCAQAGNVNTGSFDPVGEIAEITRARGAWLHVDGAFGLWARAADEYRGRGEGIEMADSWATDAHKWLNVPYDSGIAIVRSAEDHRGAMTASAAYLVQTEGVERDSVDWVPEFSRRARGVPVYAAIRALGRNGVAALVDRCCAQAARMADLLRAEPGVEVLADVVLNQVLVRFGNDDETTRRVIAAVQQDGTCWLGGTTWQGVAAMRISLSNWSTTDEDVEKSAEAIVRAFRA